MNRTVNVLLFAASLRKESVDDKLLRLVRGLIEPRGANAVHASMADLDCPSYDQDAEAKAGIPAGATRRREGLEACDAFMISSPEYDGAMPGTLKNVIDWTSRFRLQPFHGKQASFCLRFGGPAQEQTRVHC